MIRSTFKRILLTFLLFSIIFQTNFLIADPQNIVAEHMDNICARLQKGENPESLFSISLANLPDNEVHAKLLDPIKWIQNGKPEELGAYIGTLAFTRINTDFSKVIRATLSYRDESKFIPGILATKVLKRTKESAEKETILLEREREVPLALRAIVPGASRYYIRNLIISKEDWLLIRIQPDFSQKSGKNFLKSMDAFEYYKKLPEGKTLVLTVGFALPNVGFLATKKDASKKVPKPLNKVTFGVLNKVVAAIDVRDKVHTEISKAIAEGIYQNVVGLVQVTTDSQWKDKRLYQLTEEDSNQILSGNKLILEKAKKNNWIDYKSS